MLLRVCVYLCALKCMKLYVACVCICGGKYLAVSWHLLVTLSTWFRVFVYPVADENTAGMSCCVTTPYIFTAAGIPPRGCAFSVCVLVYTLRLVCIAVRCSGSNLWGNIPVQSLYDTAVNAEIDDK